MVPAKTLADLALQKRLLMAEADAYRVTLAADLHRVVAPLRWVDMAQSRLRPVMWIGAPLAGILLTRRLPSVARWVSRGFALLRTLRSVQGMIRPPKRR